MDEPCVHWRPPRSLFFALPGRRCYECEAEEYAAWQASVKARLERALQRLARGLDAAWDAPLELDLTAPARILVEMQGSSVPNSLDYGGLLNLLGVMPGRERPCSLHPDHTIDAEGCARCWEIQRNRIISMP